MTDKTSQGRGVPSLEGALHSDPHANARDAEREMGGDEAAKRRETEQAQANKREAEKDIRSPEPGVKQDTTRIPPD